MSLSVSKVIGIKNLLLLLLLQIVGQLRSYYLLKHLAQEGEATNRMVVT